MLPRVTWSGSEFPTPALYGSPIIASAFLPGVTIGITIDQINEREAFIPKCVGPTASASGEDESDEGDGASNRSALVLFSVFNKPDNRPNCWLFGDEGVLAGRQGFEPR